jgi:hypothetical protein
MVVLVDSVTVLGALFDILAENSKLKLELRFHGSDYEE